jgi:DNA-binding NarL/FixJ family response regulator
METIKVMVADDDELVRTLLSALVASEPTMQLAGTASDTGEAIQIAAETEPDVALLDLDMPGGGGFKAAEEIVDRSARTQVIALTALDTQEAELEAMRAGAVSFLVKGAPNEEIVEAIKSAVRWRHEEEPATTAAPPPPEASVEDRIAALEERITALEQAIVRGFGRSD